jgi:uncharacterized protein (DUF2147 family)
MMRHIKMIMLGILFGCIVTPIFANDTNIQSAVAGYWQTIDGKTQQPTSVIEVHRVGQLYEGKIIKIYREAKDPAKRFCQHCTGDQQGKPILGLVIINNMQCDEDYCRGGTILDPRNGKLYHAHMKLMNDGKQLNVHGYVGIPLFGKTVVWNHLSKP